MTNLGWRGGASNQLTCLTLNMFRLKCFANLFSSTIYDCLFTGAEVARWVVAPVHGYALAVGFLWRRARL